MKQKLTLWLLILSGLPLAPLARAQTYVMPKLGGGQVAAEMVHIDIYYDAGANILHATVDDSYGTPELRALDDGLMFDPAAAYAVLNGKAYNAQYGWNAGGMFTLPPGSAIWIEQLDHSPELEVYEGHGRWASYTPIFGTENSSALWKWSGVMVHNTYAVLQPARDRYFAEYHMYFGDAATGSPVGFTQYDDAFVRLEWTTVPTVLPSTFKFGAEAQTNGAALVFLNAADFGAGAGFVMNCQATNGGLFEYCWPLLVLPATCYEGGPAPGAPALGSVVGIQPVCLSGPPGGGLSLWGTNGSPICTISAGEACGTNVLRISGNDGAPESDPYGYVAGCRLTVNRPGLYCLGFRAVDASTNGPGGGPIHAASSLCQVYFQAGVTVAVLEKLGGSVTARFGGECGKWFYLERCSALGQGGGWQTVAGPLAGTNRLQQLTDPAAAGASGFYRLRASP